MMASKEEIAKIIKEILAEDPTIIAAALIKYKITTKQDIREIISHMDKRFEDMNKRFEDLIHYVDSRFEEVNRRITLLQWIVGLIGGVSLTGIISILVLIAQILSLIGSM